MVSCKIFSEETYGKEFFKKLIKRLKSEDIVDGNLDADSSRLPGKCYSKSERVIKVATLSFDKVAIIADAEGPQNSDDVLNQIYIHIPNPIKSKVEVILLDYMIEEWICVSLGKHWGARKPSEVINDYLMNARGAGKGYKKSELPNFVNGLDISILRRNSPSFQKFINFLSLA